MILTPLLDVTCHEEVDGVHDVVFADEARDNLSEDVSSEEPPNFVNADFVQVIHGTDCLELVGHGGHGNVPSEDASKDNDSGEVDV